MVRSHSVASGDFIIEYGMYVGEVFNQQEFRRRASKFDKNKHYYFMALSGGEIVGATARTEATLRASPTTCGCDPVAETQKVREGLVIWTLPPESLRNIYGVVILVTVDGERTTSYRVFRHTIDESW